MNVTDFTVTELFRIYFLNVTLRIAQLKLFDPKNYKSQSSILQLYKIKVPFKTKWRTVQLQNKKNKLQLLEND